MRQVSRLLKPTWLNIIEKEYQFPSGGAAAEWIQRFLLMLEVRGSNPGHSASKKYHHLFPDTHMVAVAASGLQGPCRQICGCDQGSGIQTKKIRLRSFSSSAATPAHCPVFFGHESDPMMTSDFLLLRSLHHDNVELLSQHWGVANLQTNGPVIGVQVGVLVAH